MVVKWPFMSNKFSFFFLTKLKKQKQKENCDLCHNFDPTKIFIDWENQNDRQNLIFVKAINVVFKKMARNGHTMSNS